MVVGQLALHDALHLGVDGRHERVAGLAGHLAVVAEHPAHRVDGDGAVAGHAPQPPVVLLLDTGAADDRGAVDRRVPVVLRLVVLVGGDRAEVPQHVREVDAERPRVAADALLLGQHRGIVLRLLEDPQGHGLADVGGDGDGLVRRAVPADAHLAVVVTARDQLRPDAGGVHVEDVGEPLHHDVRAVLAELAQHGAVEADHPGRPVGHQRSALVVDDQPSLGLHDDVAQRLGGGAGVVGVAADDLEVVQPDEQGGEQGEDQGLDDEHPHPAALAPVGRARRDPHQTWARPGSSAPSSRISPGSTSGVSSTSQTTPRRITGSRSPIETTGSCSSSPLIA